MRLNITETNMLAVLRQKGVVPKPTGSFAGGRYHVALAGLCRAGAAKLTDKGYVLTEAGAAHLDGVEVSAGGLDPRSKMKGLKGR